MRWDFQPGREGDGGDHGRGAGVTVLPGRSSAVPAGKSRAVPGSSRHQTRCSLGFTQCHQPPAFSQGLGALRTPNLAADRMTCHWGAPRAPFAESFRFSVFVHVLRFSQPADLALTLWTVSLGICSSSDFVLLLLPLLSAGLRAEPPASSHFLQTPVLACDAARFSEAALQPPLTVRAPSAFRAALPVTRFFLLSLCRL